MAQQKRFIYDGPNANNRYSELVTVEDDFPDTPGFVDPELPDGLTDETARFNRALHTWDDLSAEVQKARADAALKAQQEADQKVTLQGQQLEEVSGMLTTASSIISTPEVAATITDQQAVSLKDLWPTWAVGQTYAKGQVVIYDLQQYRHHADSTEAATEQLNPRDANYLWTPITITDNGDVIWAAPTGYQNAYAKDAVVLYYDGKHYKSLIDGNTQVPGTDTRYWVEVTAADAETEAK